MTKKLLFSIGLISISLFSNAVTHNIATSGFTFSPATITINDVDTVQFSIGSNHNAVEVSQTTWNANGSAALSGGFSLPFGASGTSGVVTGLSVGTHYYVCAPHAGAGMKAQITVTSTVGIKGTNAEVAKNFYPNPFKSNFTIELKGNEKSIKIFNLIGDLVAEYSNLNEGKFVVTELDDKPAGVYFMALLRKDGNSTCKIIKE